ncbi:MULTISPECIES: hypothetical protein [Bacillaceae]|uniref:Uncharacterized protein n=1 Tax=Gottfriedia luciferensis TaxID=178774 RepID=A0ABX2ZTC7_9BACI|nr:MULTISPECIES: hypothetical protein [Bacillaceae]ODG92970.1 hypothetical protein BED47_17480 [Gottfriedia luciferensis]PGZ93999.1 hypothetical protein COE53_04570 [Bacillus sp. AFS029533]
MKQKTNYTAFYLLLASIIVGAQFREDFKGIPEIISFVSFTLIYLYIFFLNRKTLTLLILCVVSYIAFATNYTFFHF